MSEILTDLSTESLCRAVKQNMYGWFRDQGRARQTEQFSAPGLWRWRTRIVHPWFNGVISARPASSGDEQVVEDTLAYFKVHGASGFTWWLWWLAPPLTTADWEPLLSAHGFRLDANTPGMVADLWQLNEALPTPPNLEISPVSNAEAMGVWSRTCLAGFEAPEAMGDGFQELMADLGWEWPIRNYIAALDGKPVAVSMLFLSAGVAGIYCVATLPEARGKGIGAAITLAPLLDARKLGYRVGVLQSTDMGYPVYQRLGFREVCRIEHFYRSFEEG